MGDRQTRFAGTKEVTPGLEIDAARLSAYLSGRIAGFAGPLTVRQFKGGQSNPTYLLETPHARYVLRRKPPGKLLPSAHAVDREFRVLSALADTDVPVPRPLHLCADDEVIGTMFYVMSHADGRVFWEPLLPGSDTEERAAIYDDMNRVIAALHALDPDAIDLGDFGKPGNYFERQIKRWSSQYEASATDAIPAMDKLIDWLPAHLPEAARASERAVVHGDYRIDNIVFDRNAPRAVAVLDWELSTLGHPLADFTYHLMLWRLPTGGVFPGLAGVDLAALGLPDERAYVATYCARTGRPGIDDIDYYMAYNLFRMAAILQGIAGRVRDGTATSAHARQMAEAVRPLAELGWAIAARM